MNKVLFIGFEDCQYSQLAYSFLGTCGFDTTCFWATRERKTLIPQEIVDWRGDYIFHLKSYCILPKKIINSAKYYAVNFHPSPPKYPGSGGINWGLYNNDDFTGVTVHFMNEKIDNGDIIEYYKVPIFKNDNIETLIPRVHFKQLEAFYDIVAQIAQDGPSCLKKNLSHEWGSTVGKIRHIDELQEIDFTISKKELEKIIRATSIGSFGPTLTLHDYKFTIKKENK